MARGSHDLIGEHAANVSGYDLLQRCIGLAGRNHFQAKLLQKMRKQLSIGGIIVNEKNEFAKTSHPWDCKCRPRLEAWEDGLRLYAKKGGLSAA